MFPRAITLQSGFTYDFTNLLNNNACSEQDLGELRDRLAKAHSAIDRLRQDGVVLGHLSKDGEPEPVYFAKLPYIHAAGINSPDRINLLKSFGQALRYKTDAVISFGIGGSYLGNKVLFDVHCGEFWNAKSTDERNGYPKLYFSGNNLDPRRTEELMELLLTEAEITFENHGRRLNLILLVISKSGSTVDTMAPFMVAYDRLSQSECIELEVVAVTDPAQGEKATLLGKIAERMGWRTFAVPEGIGGRFSVLSEVGLITGACIGFDIESFLAGAKSMDLACQTADISENPAMLNAALKYIAAEKYGRDIEIFMPYADYLKSTAEWYVQLLAESLGKRYDRAGNIVHYGRTPIVAVGTTDMHAQTQQHQDGKKDKVIQFLQVAQWEHGTTIPDCFPGTAGLAELAGIKLSEALDAALQANAEALANDNRFNACITLPKLNAFHLGELLYMLMLSIAYEGELANVDAFDQPGVEAYKRIMKKILYS